MTRRWAALALSLGIAIAAAAVAPGASLAASAGKAAAAAGAVPAAPRRVAAVNASSDSVDVGVEAIVPLVLGVRRADSRASVTSIHHHCELALTESPRAVPHCARPRCGWRYAIFYLLGSPADAVDNKLTMTPSSTTTTHRLALPSPRLHAPTLAAAARARHALAAARPHPAACDVLPDHGHRQRDDGRDRLRGAAVGVPGRDRVGRRRRVRLLQRLRGVLLGRRCGGWRGRARRTRSGWVALHVE